MGFSWSQANSELANFGFSATYNGSFARLRCACVTYLIDSNLKNSNELFEVLDRILRNLQGSGYFILGNYILSILEFEVKKY